MHNVECHHWPLYILSANWIQYLPTHIGSQTRFWPPWALLRNPRAPRGNDQANAHLVPKGFQIMKIDPVVSKIHVRPGQIWSHRDFYPKGLGDSGTFYTSRSSSSELKNKFHVNPMGTFLPKRRKPEFWFMLARFGVKKDRKFGYRSFYSTRRVLSTNELKKFHVNPVETCDKKDENLTLTYFVPIHKGPNGSCGPICSPDIKVYGANMGPIWGRQDPGGPHVGQMNFAIWVLRANYISCESSANLCKLGENVLFDLILFVFGLKKDPNIGPWGRGATIYTSTHF